MKLKVPGMKRKTIIVLLLLPLLWLLSVWLRIYERSPLPEQLPRHTMPGIGNVLIAGVEQRGEEASRADTIMILSINH